MTSRSIKAEQDFMTNTITLMQTLDRNYLPKQPERRILGKKKKNPSKNDTTNKRFIKNKLICALNILIAA